jgi:hypothetical protein
MSSDDELEFSDNEEIEDDQLVTVHQGEVTMISIIRDCIKNKPKSKDIEEGYLKDRQADRLITLLTAGDANKCISLWRELRPEYDVEGDCLIFRNEFIRSRGPIGFRNEIEVYGFHESIVVEACEIHQLLNRIIKKKENRKELFFFCIYYACRNLRIPMYPEEIARRIGITCVGMTRALNSINPLHYGIGLDNFYPTPNFYLPKIIEDLQLEPNIIKIISVIIDNMMNEDTRITNYYKPQKIAMAAALVFMENNSIELPEDFDHILLKGNQREMRELKSILHQYDHV